MADRHPAGTTAPGDGRGGPDGTVNSGESTAEAGANGANGLGSGSGEEPGRRDIGAEEAPDERRITTELPGRGAGHDLRRRRIARRPGQPFDRSSPFMFGFLGAIGVFLAYALALLVASIWHTLLLVFLALFLAVGLEPLVAVLTRRRVPRGWAVVIVLFLLLVVLGLFVLAAISPIQREVHQLTKQVPVWQSQVSSGKGFLGHLVKRLHLSKYVTSSNTSKVASTVASGAIGAGRVVLSAVSSTLIVIVLTIYFLASLPSIKRFSVRLIPDSRRTRYSVLLDEILERVGGYVLGNLFTSLVAGIGTFVWATIFGLPYPVLLALLVAVFDLVPVVGSTVAGIIVALVGLAVSLPVALATAGFYLVYRLLEDYLLTPRVMRHAVDVSAVVTVLATLIGGAALGIIGALVAIPVAAAIKLLLEESFYPRLDRN